MTFTFAHPHSKYDPISILESVQLKATFLWEKLRGFESRADRALEPNSLPNALPKHHAASARSWSMK